ncbi:multidrug resistance-associated ABC transporter [Crucibulum laeve]|uniref:Multidrug resistance-associated ABC transporter n=1 Tax=Crucibulum laeve TaxID=68775 RepID=A0A5C3MFM1_9AGAR|nr:multidrug resistance-associated ABC transporter [Crucibulum laeve]
MLLPSVCSSGVFDFWDPCVLKEWSIAPPALFVLALCIYHIPLPSFMKRWTTTAKLPFQPFLTLSEAEALENSEGIVLDDFPPLHGTLAGQDPQQKSKFTRWSIPVVSIGTAEFLYWTSSFVRSWYKESSSPSPKVFSALLAAIWLYTVIRPMAKPTSTAPMDLLSIYVLLLAGNIAQLGGLLFQHAVSSVPLVIDRTLAAYAVHSILISLALAVLMRMPLAIPMKDNSMDKKKSEDTPEDYTTVWGWITFAWVYPLIKYGRNNLVNEDDVWNLSVTMRSKPVFIKFNEIRKSTLLRRLLAANSYDIMMDFALTILKVVLTYAGPFFLKRILDAIDTAEYNPSLRPTAYVYAFLAFVVSLVRAQVVVQQIWFGRRASIRVRSALMATIYEKSLKRKDLSGAISGKMEKESEAAQTEEGKSGADIGKIVNLMEGDAGQLSETIAEAHEIYGAPLEVLIAAVYLYQLLGTSAFTGFTVMVLFWPVNRFISARGTRIRQSLSAVRDRRTAALAELIGAIKFIKLFAWEEHWIKRVLDIRESELRWRIKSRINSLIFNVLWLLTPALISIISLLTYVLRGNEMTVGTGFTAIALFHMIQNPISTIPTWVVRIIQTGVSLDRISAFLREPEVSPQVSSLIQDISGTSDLSDDGLGLVNATLIWNSAKEGKQDAESQPHRDEDRRFELKDINTRLPEGRLTIVTGPTASGKSALLLALLGEMTLLEGQIMFQKDPSRVDDHGLIHTVSYAAQTPWLQHRSIKENITFGYPYDQERYDQVIEACALRHDLEILEDGDSTEIGARGVTLSGGQKARVALARAVYARTKYVLLDDPLNAVDSDTARILYESLICGPLLAGRTVVLVTHQVALVLPAAHYVVSMLNGRVNYQGTVEELQSRGLLHNIPAYLAIPDSNQEHHRPNDIIDDDKVEGQKTSGVKAPRKLVEDEHRETGSVKLHVYSSYLKASSYWIWVFLIINIIIHQLLQVAEKLWIKVWGEAYTQNLSYHNLLNPLLVMEQAASRYLSQSNTALFGIRFPSTEEDPLFYAWVFAVIGLVNVFVCVVDVAGQFVAGFRASRVLFRNLLGTIMRGSFRFHDTTPQGRILNRFGSDFDTIDSSIAWSIQTMNNVITNLLAAVITVAVVFPSYLIPAACIGYIYRELAISYLHTGRDLRRMAANTRSPIFSDFTELLEGIVTVRAFCAERRFLAGLHRKLDTTSKMSYMFWMTNRWLILYYDILGALALLVTMLFSISKLSNGAGLAGLCITSTMMLTGAVDWTCQLWAMLEVDLNSMERIVEYMDIPQEPPAIVDSHRPPASWPSSSKNRDLLSVENLVVKYAPELPNILHNISFALRSGERVGLLGRTGSGKSTLAMSLLRFVHPVNGRIVIDGIDISTIGTHDLRSRITFIPQDAALFSGSLRDNLDPFGEYDDSECLNALYRVHLIARPNVIPETTSNAIAVEILDSSRPSTVSISLDTEISAGGINFSHGQKQLIALARALLRRSNIVILDEATSSIDFETDNKIQMTIREEFRDSLLLTVAHRLRTVIDYDRLIVLDGGKISEFDTPWNLIQKDKGIFRNMCLKSGLFEELHAAAQVNSK